MATDLAKMSDKALAKLRRDIDGEFKKRDKAKRDKARKDAEAAAKKHGFKLADLVGAAPAKAPAKAAKKAPLPGKYANPQDKSQTWSGRGRQPSWYKAAISAGADPKSLEI